MILSPDERTRMQVFTQKLQRMERAHAIMKYTLLPSFLFANLVSSQLLAYGHPGRSLIFLGMGFMNVFCAYRAYKTRREILDIWEVLKK